MNKYILFALVALSSSCLTQHSNAGINLSTCCMQNVRELIKIAGTSHSFEEATVQFLLGKLTTLVSTSKEAILHLLQKCEDYSHNIPETEANILIACGLMDEQHNIIGEQAMKELILSVTQVIPIKNNKEPKIIIPNLKILVQSKKLTRIIVDRNELNN